MKKIISIALISMAIVACNNNKSSTATSTTGDSATTSSSNTSNTKIDKSAMYGRWNYTSALIKITDANGKVLMNDTAQGGANDYFLINPDGTTESHMNNINEKGKFKFNNDNEIVIDDANKDEKGTIKIISLTAKNCTMAFNVQKNDGSKVETIMYFKR